MYFGLGASSTWKPTSPTQAISDKEEFPLIAISRMYCTIQVKPLYIKCADAHIIKIIIISSTYIVPFPNPGLLYIGKKKKKKKKIKIQR